MQWAIRVAHLCFVIFRSVRATAVPLLWCKPPACTAYACVGMRVRTRGGVWCFLLEHRHRYLLTPLSSILRASCVPAFAFVCACVIVCACCTCALPVPMPVPVHCACACAHVCVYLGRVSAAGSNSTASASPAVLRYAALCHNISHAKTHAVCCMGIFVSHLCSPGVLTRCAPHANVMECCECSEN